LSPLHFLGCLFLSPLCFRGASFFIGGLLSPFHFYGCLFFHQWFFEPLAFLGVPLFSSNVFFEPMSEGSDSVLGNEAFITISRYIGSASLKTSHPHRLPR
jgi:hypothetical protein